MTRLFSLLITFLLSFNVLHADSISFHADSMQAELAKGKERTVLTGNATLITDDMVIRADVIELYGEDFIFAQCSGNVRVSNKKKGLEIVSEKLYYNRRDKITRIQGNAVLEDREAPVPLRDAVANMRVIEALVCSTKSGSWAHVETSSAPQKRLTK